MFQRVSADNVSRIEGRLIGRLKNFRQSIEPYNDRQVRSSVVACREQQYDQQHQSRTYLDCGVKAQIADAMKFACVPLQDTGDARSQKHQQQQQSQSNLDALGDQGCSRCGKCHHDRQPVPNEPCVVWIQVVVRRTERRKQYSRKRDEVWPSFARIDELSGGGVAAGSKHERDAHNSHYSEWQVRGDVAEAMIRERMI